MRMHGLEWHLRASFQVRFFASDSPTMLRSQPLTHSGVAAAFKALSLPQFICARRNLPKSRNCAAEHAARKSTDRPTATDVVAAAFLAAKKGVKFGEVNGKTGSAARTVDGRESRWRPDSTGTSRNPKQHCEPLPADISRSQDRQQKACCIVCGIRQNASGTMRAERERERESLEKSDGGLGLGGRRVSGMDVASG